MKSKRFITILFHLLAWALLLSIPILFFKPHRSPDHEHEYLGIPEIASYVFLISLFYINAYLLIPFFLSKKKIITYVLLVVAILLLISILNALLTDYFYPFPQGYTRHSGFKIFPGIFIFAISLSYRILLDNSEMERIRKEKETENLKTELTFLRSQVSPHFMFNILNNMVSLARKKSDRMEAILLELSNLMRYMLYESDEEKVSVEKEIEYLKSYIGLQMLRFGDDVKVNFNVQKSVLNNSIEPMLLIPLVENAFKHGTGMTDSEIDIQLMVPEDGVFIRVINKFNKEFTQEKDKNSGIGLTNLKRRLNLLYPEKHELIISEDGIWFIVTLNLQLT